MFDRRNFIKITFSAIFAGTILSCGLGGSGGGSSDPLVAAFVSVDAYPREIDSGDRIRVTAYMSDIKEDGVLLKFHYSDKLIFINNSALLKVGKDQAKVNPAFNESLNSRETYLVFDLPHSAFGEKTNAELEVVVEGQGKLTNSDIEIEADFNDPNLTADEKFTILRPEFNKDDSVEVTVKDSSGNNQPTITPTPEDTNTPTLTPTLTSTRTPRPSLTPTPTP